MVRIADGVLVGKTPWEELVNSGSSGEQFLLHLPGYLDDRIEFEASSDQQQSVALRKVPPKSRHIRHERERDDTPQGPELRDGVLDPFAR